MYTCFEFLKLGTGAHFVCVLDGFDGELLRGLLSGFVVLQECFGGESSGCKP